MDLSHLAQALTDLLAPALPFLLEGGKKAAEKGGERLAAVGWERAKTLWDRLRRAEGEAADSDLTDAAREVAMKPSDAGAWGALRFQLQQHLKRHPELAEELASHLEISRAEVQGGPGSVPVGRDVKGNVIVINVHTEISAESLATLVGSLQGAPSAPPSTPPPPDLEKATRRYLRHLVDRYQSLDFRGMGVTDRLPLRLALLEMYIPLTARVEMPEGETWARELRVAGRRAGAEEAEAMGRRLGEPQPVLQLLGEGDGLVLLGDPGAGKTTFLKFLTLALATGQGDKLGLGDRLPVLVPVAGYAAALEEGEEPLDRFIARHLAERGLAREVGPLLERALAAGSALLLLDGLDEVREEAARHLVVERVRDFYAAHRGAGNKFVLTSRIVGYREVRFEAEGLHEATLVDFGEEEIEAFVAKWTAAVARAAVGATSAAEEEAAREQRELLLATRANPGVRALAANPLLLTILALMKRQGVALPERRVELYQRYVETLLRTWNLARSLAGRSAPALDAVAALRVLAPVALWMQETSPAAGVVKEGDLRRRLVAIFRERGAAEPAADAAAFLRDMRQHAGLLIERGGRRFGFLHLTFQEYLAAVAIVDQGQEEVGPIVDALGERLGDPRWREVSLLAVGYLGIVQQRDGAAGSVLEELLRRDPEEAGEAGQAVVLAGEAVADAWPGGVTPRCRQRVVVALLAAMREREEVPPRRRAAAGHALAKVGDPRPEVMTLDGMEICYVPAGELWMGSGEDDEEAYEDEKPLHRLDLPYAYWMGRFPVTVAQFREYVAASGHQHEDPESLEGPANDPVVRVSWEEAQGFCHWLTERWRQSGALDAGWRVALPSEAEWEKAARGGLEVPEEAVISAKVFKLREARLLENPEPQRIFPWRSDFDSLKANAFESEVGRVSAVGCFPAGASPYGCEEMSGNVLEWTRSLWGKDGRRPEFAYPYVPGDGREDASASSDILRVLRGGSYFYDARYARCASRVRNNPRYRYYHAGFRVVLSPFNSEL